MLRAIQFADADGGFHFIFDFTFLGLEAQNLLRFSVQLRDWAGAQAWLADATAPRRNLPMRGLNQVRLVRL